MQYILMVDFNIEVVTGSKFLDVQPINNTYKLYVAKDGSMGTVARDIQTGMQAMMEAENALT